MEIILFYYYIKIPDYETSFGTVKRPFFISNSLLIFSKISYFLYSCYSSYAPI